MVFTCAKNVSGREAATSPRRSPPRFLLLCLVVLVVGSTIGTVTLFRGWPHLPVTNIPPAPTKVSSVPTKALTLPSPSPQPIDPHYTASDICEDINASGGWCGYGLTPGTSIEAFTNYQYAVSVKALTSVTWQEQRADGFKYGIWVYAEDATAASAYQQVGSDYGSGNIPHYNYPQEYSHGRCLALSMGLGDVGGMAPWGDLKLPLAIQRVLDQYCIA